MAFLRHKQLLPALIVVLLAVFLAAFSHAEIDSSTNKVSKAISNKLHPTDDDVDDMLRFSGKNKGGRLIPKGVNDNSSGDDYERLSIYMPGGGVVTGRAHRNTFKVKPTHAQLPGEAAGVKFNVETVPKATREDAKKERIGEENATMAMKKEAAAFYEDPEADKYEYESLVQPRDIRIEAAAEHPDLVFAGGQGFLYACLTAFAQHLPLSLGPDHVWSVLSYAFAKHVDQNAEALRKKFVSHEGKKRLEVRADHMRMSGGDTNSGSPPKEWEETIFPEFSRQIRDHIGEKTHEAIAADFTTTTPAARAAHEITLMSSMKNYFSYGMSTMCGIPSISLLGTEEDWVSLRARAEELGKLMTPEFSSMWMPLLLPVLDEFVQSYKGNVNHGFWQSMVKLRDTGGGSGSYSFISGWLQILFPYLKSGHVNNKLKPWQDAYFSGPEPEQFPAIVSSAPVDWDYFGETFNLHFHSTMGCVQNSNDGTLRPANGWYISHDPPEDSQSRLKKVKAEIDALLKGHTKEAQSEPLDREAPWYRRVHVLHLEQLSLEGPNTLTPLKRRLEEAKGGNDWEEIHAARTDLRNAMHQNVRNVTTDEMIKAHFQASE